MTGTRLLVEADTGRVIDRLDTSELDDHAISLRCRNRRSAVCVAYLAIFVFIAVGRLSILEMTVVWLGSTTF